MNCCSGDDAGSQTLSAIFRSAMDKAAAAVTVAATEDFDLTAWITNVYSSDYVVSILFVLHIFVVVTFLISHCGPNLRRSQYVAE